MAQPFSYPDDSVESLLERMEADRDLGRLTVDEAVEYARLIVNARVSSEVETKLEDAHARAAAEEFDAKMSEWKLKVTLAAAAKIHDAADELCREVLGLLGRYLIKLKGLSSFDSNDVADLLKWDEQLGDLIAKFGSLTVALDLRRQGKSLALFEAVAGELGMDGPPDE